MERTAEQCTRPLFNSRQTYTMLRMQQCLNTPKHSDLTNLLSLQPATICQDRRGAKSIVA